MSDSPLTNPIPITITAHHEAAHAVVQYRTAGFSDGFVTILPATTTTVHGEQVGTRGHTEDCWSDSYCAEHMEARILSCYAGGHAQRRCDPNQADLGCEGDEETAEEILRAWGWEHREQEFRDRSRDLVVQHWVEIVAVATELMKTPALDSQEVELIADAAIGAAEFRYGDFDRELAAYRAFRGKWRGTVADDEEGGA